MSSLFGKKKKPEQVVREQKRELGRTERQLQRDRAKLENEERQLVQQIKRAADKGDKIQAQALAKQLVRVRGQREKSFAASAKITGISGEVTSMANNMKMGQAMSGATKVMAATNKAMNVQKVQRNMMEFEKQNQRMELTTEMMNDTIEGVMDDDQEEADDIMNQVLDEIGIELGEKMAHAPTTKLTASEQLSVDDDLAARLDDLKA